MRTLLLRSAALLALAMSVSACAGGQVAEMDAMTPDDSTFVDDFVKDLYGPNPDSPPEPGAADPAIESNVIGSGDSTGKSLGWRLRGSSESAGGDPIADDDLVSAAISREISAALAAARSGTGLGGDGSSM